MKHRSNYWQEVEEKLSKPRKKRPRIKVSGRSVLRLKQIIASKKKS